MLSESEEQNDLAEKLRNRVRKAIARFESRRHAVGKIETVANAKRANKSPDRPGSEA
jgi:predicted component of type VI protein secretion system